MADPTRHQRMTRQSQIPIAPTSSLTKTQPRQRPRFDCYDQFRDFPRRRAITGGGYYEFLNQQELELPLSKEEKRTILVITAQKTRPISHTGIPVPNINRTPEKSILKQRYPERSNRGQPPPSNDISSASFQLNLCATSIASVGLLKKFELYRETYSETKPQFLDTVSHLIWQCQQELLHNLCDYNLNWKNYARFTKI